MRAAAVPGRRRGRAPPRAVRRARAPRVPATLLAFPSLAYYAAFFLIPLGFLVLFAVATPVGFGEVAVRVQHGELLRGAGLDLHRRLPAHAALRPALGTVLTIVVGYPLAYWIARYAPPTRKNLLLLLIIVPFWTSFLIRTYSFLIVLDPEFPLSDGSGQLGLTSGPLEVLYTNDGACRSASSTTTCRCSCCRSTRRSSAWTGRCSTRRRTSARRLGGRCGRSRCRCARRASITGALLVFIPMMGEYVIPLILGGGKVDLIGNIDPARVPRAAGLPVRLGGRAAADGGRCRCSSCSTCS